MNSSSVAWLTLAACLAYVVAIDANVLTALHLLVRVAKVWLQRQWFLVRYNPGSPWVRYAIDQNSKKLAKQLMKEIEDNNG